MEPVWSGEEMNETVGRDSVSAETARRVEVLCYCYFMPVVCLVGIVGNSANLMTLASPRLRAVTYMYLRAMAVADVLTLLAVLPFVYYQFTDQVVLAEDRTSPHHIYSYPWAFFIGNILLITINWPMTTTTLLVVALTLERYMSVCWPLQFRQWNSPTRAIVTIVMAYIVPMGPYWIKYLEGSTRNRTLITIYNYTDAEGRWSEVREELVKYGPSYSKQRDTPLFQGLDLAREILFKGIPILTIALLNVLIIIAFRRHLELRKRIQSRATTGSRDNRSLLFLLAGIVVIFFLCKTPAAINNIFITDARKGMPSYKVFRAIANVMEVANHALNFYVFCLCSGDYRSIFLEKFPCIQHTISSSERIGSYLRQKLSSRVVSLPKIEDPAAAEEPHLSPAPSLKLRHSTKLNNDEASEALLLRPSQVILETSTSGVFEIDTKSSEERNGEVSRVEEVYL